MTIFNLGSINIDFVYDMKDLPQPGETVAAKTLTQGLGGKGANQTIAIARAGGQVDHIGAVGNDAKWAVELLIQSGAKTRNIAQLATPTGHAIIFVDQRGENQIALLHGANWNITPKQIETAFASAKPGDWFLLQNETNFGGQAAKLAHDMGLKVCYSAAPFSLELAYEILPYTDLLIVNEIEFKQAQTAFAALDTPPETIVTLGAKGARYTNADGTVEVAAFKSDAVDTTGAGDTFLGYALAAIDRGAPIASALKDAAAAAAIQVSRRGAAASIPHAADVKKYMAENS